MPAGLQVFDRSGKIMLDLTSRHCKFFGYIRVASNGSTSIPEFSQGSPFYLLVPTGSLGSGGKMPTVRISGNTLTWTYAFANRPGFYAAQTDIYYGVY